MSDTTTAQRYFVITVQSCSGPDMGKTLLLGFGKSEKDAWRDATGEIFRKKPDWDCHECDADFYEYRGTAGKMLSFTATPAFYDTDLTPIDLLLHYRQSRLDQ
jgi:hypothetical protein